MVRTGGWADDGAVCLERSLGRGYWVALKVAGWWGGWEGGCEVGWLGGRLGGWLARRVERVAGWVVGRMVGHAHEYVKWCAPKNVEMRGGSDE